MAYTTQADIEALLESQADLVELTDYQGLGTVNQTILDKAIAIADAMIDSKITVTGTPDLIEWISSSLAIAFLYERHGNLAKHVSDMRDMALKWLDDLASGAATTTGVAKMSRAARSTVDDQIAEFTMTKYDSGGNEENEAERFDDSAGSMDTW